MQSMMIPITICEEIGLIAMSFIWGFSNEGKKLALVSWNSVCQLKSCGGPRIRQLRDHNTSFILKIGFNVVTNPSALWVKVLQSKYGIKEGIPDSTERRRCSFLWRTLI